MLDSCRSDHYLILRAGKQHVLCSHFVDEIERDSGRRMTVWIADTDGDDRFWRRYSRRIEFGDGSDVVICEYQETAESGSRESPTW